MVGWNVLGTLGSFRFKFEYFGDETAVVIKALISWQYL